MSDEGHVSRAEFSDLVRRVNWIDEHGTRAVGSLPVQIAGLTRDIVKVELGMENHARQHEAEARERQQGKRWLIAGVVVPTAAAIIAGLGAVLAMVLR